MNNDYVDYGSLAALLGPQTQALQAIAMRPQKTSSITDTTTTSTPYALADMLARRDTIGSKNEALLNALKGRETAGYGIANALAQMAPAEGYGNWATNALRTFGAGVKGYTDAEVARQQAAQELAQKDLETALAYDKAMGETQTQRQAQTMGYTPMEYGTAGTAGTAGGAGAGGDDFTQKVRQEVSGQSLADTYKTISENPLTFSNLAPLYQDANSRALKSGIDQIGVQNLGRAEFQYLSSIMPKGFSGAINTAKEQELMRPLTTAFKEGTGTAKTSAITNFYGSLYDEYATQAAAQGMNMPVSKQEYINSRLSKGREFNPAYFAGQSKDMYKNAQKAQSREPNAGFVVNGYRFKGGDVHDKNNWEAVK